MQINNARENKRGDSTVFHEKKCFYLLLRIGNTEYQWKNKVDTGSKFNIIDTYLENQRYHCVLLKSQATAPQVEDSLTNRTC